jgi:hypothetical protein
MKFAGTLERAALPLASHDQRRQQGAIEESGIETRRLPSVLKIVQGWIERLKNSSDGISALADLVGGSDAWVLVRRRNSSLIRSSALVVRNAFHCEQGKAVKLLRVVRESSRRVWASCASRSEESTAGVRRRNTVLDHEVVHRERP